MVDVIDDFDSVMSQVMKELETEEQVQAPEIFNEVVEYQHKDKVSNNDTQSAADALLKETEKKMDKIERVEPNGLFIEKSPGMVSQSYASKSNSGSFSIDLEGIIGVDLKLKFGDKELFITCDDEQLIIRLGDGSSFNIPFKGKIEKAA